MVVIGKKLLFVQVTKGINKVTFPPKCKGAVSKLQRAFTNTMDVVLRAAPRRSM